MRGFILFVIACAIFLQTISACSNLIVSPGASKDTSSIVAYNADSGTLYGSLYHYAAADHPIGSKRTVFDWDTGRYLGEIDEVPHTYNVVGNVNEYGVIIGETTFGGLVQLESQAGAKIDYGSLIWITLQRSKSAKEAINTIADLMNRYGYASEGESFSIADPNETWIMEIIGKGEYELGAVWVARKVPDGYITAHANQARITTFPLDDPENTLYSPDVISFARKIGVYPADKPDSEFSFSDIYDPVTFDGARFCEARVWSIFSTVLGSDWSNQYLDYAQGYNLTNRMPLFVKVPEGHKISIRDAMEFMGNHYENSQLDMSGKQFSDVGAFTYSPYRTHPISWTSNVEPDGVTISDTPIKYIHERPIATPQTGWNFVAQSRKWVPRELAALMWFGVDDSGTTVRFPIYGSATRVPPAFAGQGAQDGVVPPMMEFSLQSAFYVFNLVANWAYSRWDLIYPEVYNAIVAKETQYHDEIKQIEAKAVSMFQEAENHKDSAARDSARAAAVDYVTTYSVNTGNQLVNDWFKFFGQLFVKYRDGYVVSPNAESKNCGCSPVSASYPQSWFDRIVKDTKSHYLYGTPSSQESEEKRNVKGKLFQTKKKTDLLALR